MASPSDAVDVRDMLVVHESFRRQFHRAPGLVAGVTVGDTVRAAVVADHLDLMQEFLHLHHTGEDELLWPKLAERAAEELAAVIPTMEEQHSAIDTLGRRISAALTDWRAGAGADERDTLVKDLMEFGPLLTSHLALEEEKILAVVPRYLTVSEWHQFGDHAIKGLPKSRLPIVFGMLAHLAEPEVVTLMLASAPLVPRLLMPRLGPRAYARHVKRVYGAASTN
ncbi:hemerythrin domain-containing protein [Streptomyces sp. ME01-24h]|nr:hemerythrin domain-containing protein [Streptomyces sp. ME19-03-3]MDX3356631.1 hemerythrin domain-containing protein [Streptomyces sp. ME01-24h]